jgi:uncharacterized protein (DUF433 family)
MMRNNLHADGARDYSVKEAAALAGVSEKAVRNEIERGAIAVRRVARSLRVPEPAVYCLALARVVSPPLRRRDKRDLCRLLGGGATRSGGWRLDRRMLRNGPVAIDPRGVAGEVRRRRDLMARGRRRIARDPDILGGEAVFRGTRLLVRHIGELALSGEPVARIRRDYPALSAGDVDFACLFAAMKPDVGRPRHSRLRFRRATA